MVSKWETRAATCIPDAVNWRLILAEFPGESKALAGFVCLNATEERDRGVLLDNLHVARVFRRRGVASALIRLCAEIVAKEFPGESMHLSCLEANASARALYDRLGGQLQDGIMMWDPEGGKPTPCVRYAWPAEALHSLIVGDEQPSAKCVVALLYCQQVGGAMGLCPFISRADDTLMYW